MDVCSGVASVSAASHERFPKPPFLLCCLLCNCPLDVEQRSVQRHLGGTECRQYLAERICAEVVDELHTVDHICDECFNLVEQWHSMRRILDKLTCSISDKYRRARLRRRSEKVCVCVDSVLLQIPYAAFLAHCKGKCVAWTDAVAAVAAAVLRSAGLSSSRAENINDSGVSSVGDASRASVAASPVSARSAPGDSRSRGGRTSSSAAGSSRHSSPLPRTYAKRPRQSRQAVGCCVSTSSAAEATPGSCASSQFHQQPAVRHLSGSSQSSGTSLASTSGNYRVVRVLPVTASTASTSSLSHLQQQQQTVSRRASKRHQLVVRYLASNNSANSARPLAPPDPPASVDYGPPAAGAELSGLPAGRLTVLHGWRGIGCGSLPVPAASAAVVGACRQLATAREREETMSVLSVADTASLLDRTETLSVFSDNTDMTVAADEVGGLCVERGSCVLNDSGGAGVSGGSMTAGSGAGAGLSGGVGTDCLSTDSRLMMPDSGLHAIDDQDADNERDLHHTRDTHSSSVSFAEPSMMKPERHSVAGSICADPGEELLREFAETMSNISEGVILDDLEGYFEELHCRNDSQPSTSAVPATTCTSQVHPAHRVSSTAVTSEVATPEVTPSLQCPLCQRRFRRRRQLCAHMRVHGAAPFRCVHCRRHFRHYYKLHIHVRRDHRPPPRAASVPSQTSTAARDHQAASNAIAPRALSASAVVVGERDGSGGIRRDTAGNLAAAAGRWCQRDTDGRFVCSECGRSFRQLSTLRQHRRLHTGLAFVCRVCGRAFAAANDLRRHMDTHGDRKPYSCKACGRHFKLAASLALHAKLHSDSALVCALCERRFDRRDSLVKHMDTHKASADLECLHCGKLFKQQRTLDKHVRRMHVAASHVSSSSDASRGGAAHSRPSSESPLSTSVTLVKSSPYRDVP